MLKTNVMCLTALALGCAAFSASAETGSAKAGTLDAVAGTVQITHNGQSQTAAAGSEVDSGDVINVGDGSSARLHMADNAVFELGASTEFAVTSYSYVGTGVIGEARSPATAKYELKHGDLRTITGSIGKSRGDNYVVVAPEGQVRVHGTDFAMQEGKGLLVIDYAGSVTVGNDTGQIELSPGQFVFVASLHSPLHWKDLNDIVHDLDIDLPVLRIRLPIIPIPASPS